MIHPRKLKQYYESEYPQLDQTKLDINALINNFDLRYNDDRDMERKSAHIDESSAGELTAKSVSLRNLLYVNQRGLWEMLGWTSLSLLSIDYKSWTCLAAILVLLKDFRGLMVHDFSPIETNVLYAIYRTGTPDNPYFIKLEVEQTYSALFDLLSSNKLNSVLLFLVELQVIEDEGDRFAIRQEIQLHSRFRH